ncbi:MAG: Ferredoxin-1 [Opitutia bacterium UBA7350]|nr:MAG: Ferredoxin-1 [Opitutae bacterium UBA7350]
MAKIIFKLSNMVLEWSPSEDNILELAEASGLNLSFGCRMGNCTSCQQKILSGEVAYENGHTGEPDEEHALLCCCQPKGEADVVIEA